MQRSLVSCHIYKLQHYFMVAVKDLHRHPRFNAQGKVVFTDFWQLSKEQHCRKLVALAVLAVSALVSDVGLIRRQLPADLLALQSFSLGWSLQPFWKEHRCKRGVCSKDQARRNLSPQKKWRFWNYVISMFTFCTSIRPFAASCSHGSVELKAVPPF